MHQMNSSMYQQHNQHLNNRYRQSLPMRLRQPAETADHQVPHSRCVACKLEFGSFFEECQAEAAPRPDMISSSIKSLKHVTRFPMVMKCNHRMCQDCLQVQLNNSNARQFYCPSCNMIIFASSVSCDYKLFGEQVYKNETKFDQVKELIALPYFNQENERLVGKDFERFIMRCSHCSDDSGARENFANLFCFTCDAIFCNECHVHTVERSMHMVQPIGLYFSNQTKCAEHPKTTIERYCVQCNVFVCQRCLVDGGKWGHDNHELVSLMNNALESSFAQNLNNTLKKILVDSRKLLKVFQKELTWIKTSVLFDHDNLKTVKTNVQKLLQKKSHILQAVHICEAILTFFRLYFNNENYQMFDRNKRLLQTTRAYVNYAESTVKLDEIYLYSTHMSNSSNNNKSTDRYFNHHSNAMRAELSKTIQLALDNLKCFIKVRDKQIDGSLSKMSVLSQWTPDPLVNPASQAPQVQPYNFSPKAASYTKTMSLRLLKPHDFTASKDQSAETENNPDSPALSDEIKEDADPMFGAYGRGALRDVYDPTDSTSLFTDPEYELQKMDTSWQTDQRRIAQHDRMRQYQHENMRCSYPKSLTGDVSMSGLSSASSSMSSEDENGSRRKLSLGTTIKVKFVNRNSPTLFSVVLERDVQLYSDFAPRVSIWCADNQDLIALSDQEISAISPGDVFAHYRNDVLLWTRVRVRSIQLDASDVEESKVLVYFMDIGDLYEVEARTLAKLDKSLAEVRQTVISCYLYNIRPYSETDENDDQKMSDHMTEDDLRSFTWKTSAMVLMHAWEEEKPITLTVLENKYDEYYGVDLNFDLAELIRTDASLKSCTALYDVDESSLTESFIKCKIAQYINEHDELTFKHTSRKMPKYMQMQALYTNEKCLAKVSHLDSLNEFYLRKLYSENDNGASFSELMRRVNSLYNSNPNSFYLKVFAPEPGMPVAAVFPVDESWYRGEIESVNPHELSCRVLFVDFGNVEVIPLDRLRYLTKEIIIDDVRAFNCRLFGVSFKTPENLTKALNYVYMALENAESTGMPVQVHVKRIIETDSNLTNKQGIHEIIMRCPVGDKITNVNVMLNKMGYAETDDLSIYDGEKEPTKVEDLNETMIVKKQPKPTALEQVAKEVCGISINRFKSKPANSVYCRVKNAVSPSEIWVQDIVDAESCFEQFHQSFCQTYEQLVTQMAEPEIESEERPMLVRDEWKVGDLAVMRKVRPTSNGTITQYFRCKINKLVSEGTFQVICVDTGEYKTVSKDNLFVLVDEYFEKPDFKAKKCFIVGVQPTGTTNGEWGSLAKAFTAETLEDSLVYVVFTSGRRADDSYETIIYVNTQQAKNVNNLILPDQSKENEYIKFSDILNLKGFAMLLSKKKALDMLLDYQHSYNSASLLTIHGSFHSYPSPIAFSMDMFGNELHDALVTYVDLTTGAICVQLLHLFHTRHSLRRMSYDFTNAYKSGDDQELKFRDEDLLRHLNHTDPQAYVCKIKSRYYRCELNQKETIENRLLDDQSKMRVFLIDYGFSADVETENIYRPMIAYLQICPLAFKFRVNLQPSVEYKQDLPAVIHSLLHNRLTKAKVLSIEDSHMLCGDLICPEAKKWLSCHLMLDDAQSASPGLVRDLVADVQSYKKFQLKPEHMGQSAPVVVTWIDSINSIWMEVKPNDESSVEANLRLEHIHESMLEAVSKRTLRNLKIEEIRENAPCCSIYKNDFKVYRAKILRVNYIEELAVVRYVDFGNEEEIGFEELFELDKEHVDLCEQAIQCRLKNVAINTPGNELLTPEELKSLINQIHSELDQTLNEYNDEEKTLCAKFSMVDAEDESYEAELFFEFKSSPESAPSSVIAYQSLVDNGLLRFKGQAN